MPPIISIASILANPSREFFFYQYIDWKVIRYLMPGSLLGAILGAWSFTRINVELIQIILGVFLLTYVFQYQFSKTRFHFQMKRPWFFPLGMTVSFLSGLVGATGPILNPFMLSYGKQAPTGYCLDGELFWVFI
ncbi:MAG: sulfite exporter TauE/SafE family protein [Proteobacteria bacterium]|nr:sulfite exporter TauE/SafE family protein [Pseudomonadota bacterium]